MLDWFGCLWFQKETEFRLLVWFINQDSNWEEKSYPLQLTCPLQVPWGPRELVCEQNYMEVKQISNILYL